MAHHLEYDPVALAVLLTGIAFVELIVFTIWTLSPRADMNENIGAALAALLRATERTAPAVNANLTASQTL
jgi:hypothetical protein